MTLIMLNAIAASAVVYGIVWLLGHGIHADRRIARTQRVAQLHALPARDRDRLAA